jgi:RNA polymerase sigma-70 factor (ECF subfamily)
MRTEEFQAKLMKIQNNLLNFAYMLTADRDDAYDLLQDTTLKVLDSQDKFSDNANFKGWVFTIMRNTFINNYRRFGRSVPVVESTDSLFSVNIPPEAEIENPEGTYGAAEIMQTINSFSDQYRLPFAMHIAGYKYDEISK